MEIYCDGKSFNANKIISSSGLLNYVSNGCIETQILQYQKNFIMHYLNLLIK